MARAPRGPAAVRGSSSVDEATADEPGQRAVPVASRERGRRRGPRPGLGELGEGGPLARTERSARGRSPGGDRRRDLPALGGALEPALVARPGAAQLERPLEDDDISLGHRSESPQEDRSALGAGRSRTRRGPSARASSRRPSAAIGRCVPRRVDSAAARDELEPLEEARRQHRPDRDRRRREVVLAHPADERERQRRRGAARPRGRARGSGSSARPAARGASPRTMPRACRRPITRRGRPRPVRCRRVRLAGDTSRAVPRPGRAHRSRPRRAAVRPRA